MSCYSGQLLREARRYAQITPLQISLLYHLCDMENMRGAITVNDFKKLIPKPSFAIYPPVTMDTATNTDQVSEGGW